MDESRKQFEAEVFRRAEVSGYAHMSSVLKKTSNGGYATTWVDMMWEGWQASRAAIEIKLDDKVMVEDEFDKGHNCAIDYIDYCAEAIRAAGIKVKE